MTTLTDFQPARSARPKLFLGATCNRSEHEIASGKAAAFSILVVAALGLVLAFPVMLLIAALIKLTSRGPVLFTQTRVGLDRRALSNAGGNTRRHTDQGGQPFKMYKFRTMRPADATGSRCWAQADEARITPIGRVLRKLRLDELPSCSTLLTGDMNIVGPGRSSLRSSCTCASTSRATSAVSGSDPASRAGADQPGI